jgi:hypothetical protein
MFFSSKAFIPPKEKYYHKVILVIAIIFFHLQTLIARQYFNTEKQERIL